MHYTNETRRTHNTGTPRTAHTKTRTAGVNYEGSRHSRDTSGGRGDERVRSVATSTVYVYTFFILIL